MTRKRHDDGDPRKGTILQVVPDPPAGSIERDADAALRPKTFSEYIGQGKVLDNLGIFVKAARKRGEPLDHMLLCGPPGLGKTTLAHVIANEMGAQIQVTSGPAIDHKGLLAATLTSLGEGDVLFIDEIHRLQPAVEESLYPAMEDFTIDVFIGDGPHARAMRMGLKRFTLLAATTRAGRLASPLMNRFKWTASLDYYGVDDLARIVTRSAGLLKSRITPEGAAEIARRARGTPRIANNLLRRVRDFAEVEGDGVVTYEIADHALGNMDVDAAGLDALDRNYLRIILERFGGGPVGIEAISASLGQERDTLEDWIEPFLVQEGYVARTPRGRMATQRAYDHLGLERPPPQRGQQPLL